MTATAVRTSPVTDAETLARVERFLYTEAEIMDDHRYPEWLELWTEELEYWVPFDLADETPQGRVAVICDDRPRLKERLARFDGGYAHAQIPRPVLSRTVSNVLVDQVSDGTLEVRSRFVLTLLKHQWQTVTHAQEMVFSGKAIHVLEPAGDTLRIRRKTVRLSNVVLPLTNIQFLL